MDASPYLIHLFYFIYLIYLIYWIYPWKDAGRGHGQAMEGHIYFISLDSE